MTVNVTGPDGSQFEFPDDTREDVINGALSQHYGAQEQPPQPDPTAKLSPGVRSIMHAFGEGFSQNYEDKLGLSDESKQFLAKHNIIPKDASDYTNPMKPFMAFNEGIILPLATGLDAAWRLPMALYHGAQEAGVEAGLHRDIVSIPDAFMGSPGSVMPKLARPEPFVKPSPIRPVETKIGDVPQPIDTGIARSVAAKTGLPEVDAVLNSPTTKAVIDNPVVDRSHDVPYMAGGSEPMEDPTVYIDRHVPKEQTAPRASGPGTVTFDPADPWIVHENVEQHTMELLTKEVPSYGGKNWYHGTDQAFENFDLSKFGMNTQEPGHEIAHRAVFLSSSKTAATEFANNKFNEGKGPEGKVYPITANVKKVLDVPGKHTVPQGVNGEPAFSWQPYNEAFFEQKLNEARAGGYDAVRFEGVNDGGVIADQLAVLRPELLEKGMSDAEAYRVAHFEYAEKAEQAWYRAHDIDQAAAEKEQLTWLPRIQHENPENPPPNLYEKPYPHEHVAGAQHEAVTEAPPTPDEIARAREIIAANQEGLQTSGFIAYHGSPALFDKFAGKSVDVTTDQSMAERYRQPRGQAAKGPGNLYQVDVRASQDEFLNLDKPLTEQSRQVKEALDTIESVPPGAARIAGGYRLPINDREGNPVGRIDIEMRSPTGRNKAIQVSGAQIDEGQRGQGYGIEAYKKLADFALSTGRELWSDRTVEPEAQHIYEALRKRGYTVVEQDPNAVPYDAQFKVTAGPEGPPKQPHLGMDLWDSLRDAHGAEATAKMLQDAGIAGTSRALGTYSVFDPNIANITHVNGQPLLAAAKDLGVVGPERPSIADGKPADAAARATGGGPGQPPPAGGGLGPGGVPPQPNPWRDRFEHFVGKLETAEDVKQLIRNSADERGEFPAARQGDIPLSHVDGIAQAAGVDPGELDVRGLGRNLKNDAEVRVAMQLMLQVTDNMKAAAREVRADASPENLIKLQESIMRRDLAVEQVVGLRAEWGRTGNVFQEFLRDVKDQETLGKFLRDKGRGTNDLKDIADAVDALDRQGAARFMNDMRTPTAWDKFMFYWVNALISGPITHAKYMLANAAFAGYESAVVTPVAGISGAVRRGIFGGQEGVFAGESAARLWGIVAGTPDAIMAAAKAARTGLQTPLPGQIAQNILPKTSALPFAQRQPIDGVTGTLIGIPSRGATAIHTLFNFLGYRASIEAQAYRTAAKEGLSPTDGAFWERRQNAADAPTVDMMNTAIEEGARLTYINDLSPAAKALTSAAKRFKVLNVVFPFMHIPLNILSRGVENVPVLNLIPKESREDLFGHNGAVKQDMAIARLMVGSAVGAYAANLVLNDQMTGYGPTDQKERAQWIATGHQPYSVRIGDQWISYNRFGSIGTMLGLHANLAESIPHLKPDMEELTTALTMAVHTTGRLMEDEVGMQALAGLIDAIDQPDRKGTRFVSNFAGSLLPFSSALRQTASAMDPEMRQTKTLVDGLRYYIPGERQALLPKRDWLGEPFTNAGYGGDLPIPGTSAIIQHRSAEASAIALEMQRLDLHPAVPPDRIGTVKLPPQMYDQYQVAAGMLTRQVLENWLKQPNWYDLPEFARKEIFQQSIKAARQQAAAMLQAQHPEIIVQGVENQLNRINGNKPTKLTD